MPNNGINPTSFLAACASAFGWEKEFLYDAG
jgi:hypothetical protein